MGQTQIKQIYITNVVHTDERKFGFGRIVETAEEIFIPPHIIIENNPEKNTLAIAELEPNDNGQQVQWRVRMIYDPDGPFKHLLKQYQYKEEKPAPKVEPSHAQIMLWLVEYLNSYPELIHSTQEIVDQIESLHGYKLQSVAIGRDLNRLFQQGKIAKIQMWASANNQRASRTMWTSQLKATFVFDKMVDLYDPL